MQSEIIKFFEFLNKRSSLTSPNQLSLLKKLIIYSKISHYYFYGISDLFNDYECLFS